MFSVRCDVRRARCDVHGNHLRASGVVEPSTGMHCRPGGAALFAPDFVRENFRPSTDCGGHDNQTHGLRYLEWTWDPDPADTTYVVDYAYLLRGPDRATRVEHDRHVEGLFGRGDWLRLLSEAGFQASAVQLQHSALEPGSHEVFIAKRPGGGKGEV
jgi:hypothetical protein